MITLPPNVLACLPANTRPEFSGNAVAFEVPASAIFKIAYDWHKHKRLALKLITATDERKEEGCFKIWYVFGAPGENVFVIPYLRLTDSVEFPSLTSIFHQAWNHEKKIRAFFGLKPIGHPDTRPFLLHENWPVDVFPLRKDFDWNCRPLPAQGEYAFQRVRGEGIYVIPVGPVHAGIIEPGHFHISVAGEEIVLLEPRLGYTHKGSEKLFEHLPLVDKIRLSEKISGDSSFSHSLVFCQALEQLSQVTAPPRARFLRVIFAELERVANHFGDIGAIMLDTGYNFGGSQGARLREMVLRINERLTGSRFLRGVNRVGGVARDITSKEAETVALELTNLLKDFNEGLEIADDRDSLLNRLKSTGVLPREIAHDHGVTGVAARAVGLENDARIDFPYAAYNELRFCQAETEQEGDVYARFYVRVKEVRASVAMLQNALRELPEGPVLPPEKDKPLQKNAFAVSIVEGWRGDIVYFLKTDSSGNISRVALRDPSFVNWAALEYAGLDNIVPDFPLINKSFNLSYSGNDL